MRAIRVLKNLGLTEKAAEDLDYLTGLLELSEVDVVNQAIQLYRYVQSQISEGNRLAIFSPGEMVFDVVNVRTGPQDDE